MSFPLFVELLGRYLGALADVRWLGALALLGALLFSLPAARRRLQRVAGVRRALVLALLGTGALAWAWQLRWLCDDAYISFRYAENWARGLGLVFNQGERVEGYTNFLWTALMAAFIRLGLDPGQAGVVVGLACFLALIVLVDRLGRRLGSQCEQPGLGLAPILTAASYTVASFATSGLETMFAATLALAAVERAEAGRPLVAGLCGVAAAMAHPDHGIFYAALAAALLLTPGRRRQIGAYSLPFLLVFVPYFVWRWRYYGDLFPNTYYAKSAGEAYFPQGGIYLAVGAVVTGVWAAAPLAGLGAYRFRRTVTGKFFLIGLPLFLFYVAKVGGDFMLGRLLVPAIVFVFLFADLGWRSFQARNRPRLALGFTLLVALAAVPARAIRPGEKIWNLADERTFYPLTSFQPPRVGVVYTEQARTLKAALEPRGLRPKLAIGCVGIVGYHTRLPIFDLFGLTSRSVAHTPILHRGRPGHEKLGTVGQILAAGVDLSESPLYPFPFAPLTSVQIGGFNYFLARYDPTFVAALKGAAAVADLPPYLDTLAQEQKPVAQDALACELWFLESYYFSSNRDAPRRQALIDRALKSDSSLRGLEPILLNNRPLEAAGYSRVRSFGFERREPFVTTGDAFASWPSTSAVPGQTAVHGNQGRFVNTYGPVAFDGARGLMKLPPFRIEGEVISLLVAGGRDLRNVRVTLVVDGQPVRQATGCVTEVLGRRLWNVRDLRGRTAYIEILDDSAGGWGHLLVDEITEWQGPAPTGSRP